MKVFELLKSKYIYDLDYKYSIVNNKITKKPYELSKDIIFSSPYLVITDSDDNIIAEIDDIQPLYLYPLSVLDYCNNLKKEKMLAINIYDYSKSADYLSFILKNEIKLVEFTITKDIDISLIEEIKRNNIKILINISDLSIDIDIGKIVSYANYIRLFIPQEIENYDLLRKYLNIISINKNNKALFLLKTYLCINMIDNYEKLITLFSKYKVDIFHVSKELIPLQVKENIAIDIKYQEKIRYLENKYKENSKTRFISVKNLSELYYLRFELNDTNSRKCYASFMKPYLIKDVLLPCKVLNKINNQEYWNFGSTKNIDYSKIKCICGKECDDCASIFENDFLFKVEQIAKDKDVKYYILCNK